MDSHDIINFFHRIRQPVQKVIFQILFFRVPGSW